jgi:hypothetical protein
MGALKFEEEVEEEDEEANEELKCDVGENYFFLQKKGRDQIDCAMMGLFCAN